ncbi:hypothetical protein VNO80_05616 [Phaseolus coccineus]|uniref:DUF4283 domain-containing protein n=1 Tax=Phaseolus coccineus TaxID=3886 RepID=A0AAN9RI84_PHACN
MSCEEEGIIGTLIEENKVWFDGMFDLVFPWDESFSINERFAWVHCRGILLQLWSSHCFESIGALVGKVVEVDEVTLEREVLEYARLCVKIPVGGTANLAKEVHINNIPCKVSFEEEFYFPDHTLRSLFNKWAACSVMDSKVRSEEGGGREFLDSVGSDFGEGDGVRDGEESVRGVKVVSNFNEAQTNRKPCINEVQTNSQLDINEEQTSSQPDIDEEQTNSQPGFYEQHAKKHLGFYEGACPIASWVGEICGSGPTFDEVEHSGLRVVGAVGAATSGSGVGRVCQGAAKVDVVVGETQAFEASKEDGEVSTTFEEDGGARVLAEYGWMGRVGGPFCNPCGGAVQEAVDGEGMLEMEGKGGDKFPSFFSGSESHVSAHPSERISKVKKLTSILEASEASRSLSLASRKVAGLGEEASELADSPLAESKLVEVRVDQVDFLVQQPVSRLEFSSMSDSVIENCNRIYWLKNDKNEATRI